MKGKIAATGMLAAALVGLGALTGSVIGSASAQSPTPGTQQTAPSTGQTPLDMPGGQIGGLGFDAHDGGHGFGGRHGGHFGGHGFDGGFGRAATTDNATRAISATTSLITQVKADLAYANGKMDTAKVQKWITDADALLKSAQDANAASRFEQAVSYAGAASEVARLADGQMAQALGADKLPSYSQRPQRPDGPNKDGSTATDAALTQAQASRILARTYDQLVMQGAVIKSGKAAGYLTEAQNAYKDAYTAYTAGKYSDAAKASRLAERLSSVAQSVRHAENATGNTDTPVTVPQPTF